MRSSAPKRRFADFWKYLTKPLMVGAGRTYKTGFSDIYRQKREMGKISLRRSQFRLAEKNANMAIWLGKQYLNQKDKIEEVKRYDTGQFESIVEAVGGRFDAG